MQALVILAHPEPRSFNAQLKDVAVETLQAKGHGVEVSDLYADGFDPLEGPGHYAARANPDYFEAQGEQRHAWETDAVSPQVRAEVEKLERAGRDLPVSNYMGYTVLPHFVASGVEGGGVKYSDPAAVSARLKSHKTALRAHLQELDELQALRFNGWADWDENGCLKPGVPGYSPFMRADP